MVSSQARLAVFGVALHALLIYAMFDVHFLTPLVHGMEPTTADFAAPASRLVVIVADGLRADRLFELEDAPGDDPDAPRVPRAPFLHGVAESRGRWGISHARPPTESRPGHVALLAGFYEDPSAITKGWQANAVEFDHLLNQSSAAWALGAPSVVSLFAKGIQHVRHRMYAEELEDFAASNDHAALDEWVFDRTIEILDGRSLSAEDEANGRSRDTERAALEGERVVFLLHLLGLDSAGHAYKPFGDSVAGVKAVDNVTADLSRSAFERRFDQTPRDGGTTFLFTADHGMSSRGAPRRRRSRVHRDAVRGVGGGHPGRRGRGGGRRVRAPRQGRAHAARRVGPRGQREVRRGSGGRRVPGRVRPRHAAADAQRRIVACVVPRPGDSVRALGRRARQRRAAPGGVPAQGGGRRARAFGRRSPRPGV